MKGKGEKGGYLICFVLEKNVRMNECLNQRKCSSERARAGVIEARMNDRKRGQIDGSNEAEEQRENRIKWLRIAGKRSFWCLGFEDMKLLGRRR